MEMNVSSYRSDEFSRSFGYLDRTSLPGIKYDIDHLRAVPIYAYVFLLAIGIPGNVWVACVIACVLNEKRSKAPKCVQIYILSLCFCDLVVLLFSVAVLVDLITGEWLVESVILCKLYLSNESLNKFCAPFLLVAMSFFCYVKVCQPQNIFFRRESIQIRMANGKVCDLVPGALVTVLVSMLVSIVLVSPVFIYGDLHYIVYENASGPLAVVTKCAFEPANEEFLTIFTIYGFIFSYAFPASSFVCFHAAIWCKVSKQAYTSAHNRRRGPSYLLRVTRTIFGLVVFYLANWTPYWTMVMYQALTPLETQGAMEDTGVVLHYMAHMLPYVATTGYPIIYTMMNRDIRQAYKTAVSKRRRTMEREAGLVREGTRRRTRPTIESEITSATVSL